MGCNFSILSHRWLVYEDTTGTTSDQDYNDLVLEATIGYQNEIPGFTPASYTLVCILAGLKVGSYRDHEVLVTLTGPAVKYLTNVNSGVITYQPWASEDPYRFLDTSQVVNRRHAYPEQGLDVAYPLVTSTTTAYRPNGVDPQNITSVNSYWADDPELQNTAWFRLTMNPEVFDPIAHPDLFDLSFEQMIQMDVAVRNKGVYPGAMPNRLFKPNVLYPDNHPIFSPTFQAVKLAAVDYGDGVTLQDWRPTFENACVLPRNRNDTPCYGGYLKQQLTEGVSPVAFAEPNTDMTHSATVMAAPDYASWVESFLDCGGGGFAGQPLQAAQATAPQPVEITLPAPLPNGASVHPAFLTTDEQAAMLAALDAQTSVWTTKMVAVAPNVRSRLRRTQHYGIRVTYNYMGGASAFYEATPMPAWMQHLAARIEVLPEWAATGGGTIVEATVQEYLPGQALLEHIDSPAFGPVIGVVSLGAASQFTLSYDGPAGTHKSTTTLASGDVLLIGGEARTLWKHGMDPVDGRRVSISFRSVAPNLQLHPEPVPQADGSVKMVSATGPLDPAPVTVGGWIAQLRLEQKQRLEAPDEHIAGS